MSRPDTSRAGASRLGEPPAETFRLGDFPTVSGELLREARLRYRIFGEPDLGRENGWILVFHALTGSQDVDLWWGPMLGPGRPLDTARHPVLAANLLGGCYGSSGPGAGQPFPALTPRDLARAHGPLLAALGVERLALAVGGSLGGMVALEWARDASVPTDRVVAIAAPAATAAQAIAWNAAQRMALAADPLAGLAAARAIAMITYRSAAELDARFGRRRAPDGSFEVERYLRHQGEKLVARFDPASYLALTRIMDRHDLGDLGDAARDTARRVGAVVGVGIDSDILYPAAEVAAWVEAYRRAGAPAVYEEIRSMHGHDAFLIEHDQVTHILRRALRAPAACGVCP